MNLDTLPYPYRIARHPAFAPIRDEMMPYLADLMEPAFFPSLDRLFDRLTGRDSSPVGRAFQERFGDLLCTGAGFAAGGVKALFLAQWWLRHSGILVEVMPRLAQSLLHTDFDKVPASYFRLPYPAIFVQLPPLADVVLREDAPPYRDYPIDGVFLTESPPLTRAELETYRRGPEPMHRTPPCEDTHFREVAFTFHGSPAAIGAEVTDDAVFMGSLILPCHNETLTLPDAVRFSRDVRRAHYGARAEPVTNDTVTAQTVVALSHVAKVMLYMSMVDCRPVTERAYSEAIAQARQKKNPAKRDRALRHADRLYDRIVIDDRSVPAEALGGSSEMGRRSPRGHWRRGHFHTVLYGEGRRERRLAWFRPTLIAGTGSGRAQTVYQVGKHSRLG